MSRDGAGTYNLPAGNPVVTGTTISSTWANNTLNDIATALTNSIAKDGQTTPTANLPMGTKRLTGLGAATALTDAAQATQVQNNSFIYLASVAGTNTVTGSATPTPAAYAAGQVFRFNPANTNTGATTINVSSIGPADLYANNAACVGGELIQNVPASVIHDGTRFHLISNGAPALIAVVQTLTNKRITARVKSEAFNATPTISTDSYDEYHATAMSAAITSMTTNLSGTPVTGDILICEFTDDGTPRAITWGAKFESSTVALPTITVASTLLTVTLKWNAATSKWRCLGVA
jgi:hypothetical protein